MGEGMDRRMLQAGLALALALAAGCAWQEGPVWSPDGRRVVWVRPGGGLWLADLEKNGPAVEVAPDGRSPAFLDGRRLAFLAPGGRGVKLLRIGEDEAADLLPPPRTGRYAWLAAAADGGGLLVLVAEGEAPAGRLWQFRLRPERGRPQWEALTPEETRACSPALSPDGRDLVYSTVTGEPGRPGEAVLWYLMVAAKRTRRLASVPAAEGRVGPGLRAVWLPDAKRVAYGAAGAGSFRVLTLASGQTREVRLPFGEERSVVHAAFSPEGGRAYLTTVSAGEGGGWSLGDLALADGTWKVLAESKEAPVGLRSFGPGGRFAELTPAGLRVSGPGGKRFYPASAAEFEARARSLLAANDAAGALGAIESARARAGPGEDRARMLYLASEAHAAAGDARAADAALLRGFLAHPVQNVPVAEARRRLASLTAEHSGNEALALAAAAAESAGRSARAAALYAELAGAAAEPACAAGALFRRARSLAELGRWGEAARAFLRAGEAEGFPQRDYALALAAACHLAAGREQLAAEDLMRCRDLCGTSPLAPDYARLKETLKRGAPGAPPAGSAERLRWKAAAEPRALARLVAALEPAPLFSGGSARVALDRYVATRILVTPPGGRPREIVPPAPVVMTKLSFSPDAKRLAFLAAPNADAKATRLVCIDLDGKILNGRAEDLADGSLGSFPEARGYTWGRDNLPRPAGSGAAPE